MNYYQPREIIKDGKSTGLFHYTCRNGDRIWPVGLCASDCPGHTTEQEAREHWRLYLIQGIEFTPIMREWPKEKCESEGCNEQAMTVGFIKHKPDVFNHHMFCAKHATPEEMAKFIKAGDSISSY